ncbi:MAG: hypothetical protein ACK501_06345 [Planctomycetota bacterium]|jgi:hypothetical protein
MRFSTLAVLWCVLSGALAGWFVAGVVPAALRQPYLDPHDFHLARSKDDVKRITPSLWWFEPRRYGDFDLLMDVELGENVDLDVVLRQVEPWFVDEQLPAFHGRFGVLRISTRQRGPGWHTREQALQAQDSGGIELAAGIPATVKIEARGRVLRANVAGHKLPPFVVDDHFGMFTLMTRGGDAVVHSLTVTNLGAHRPWLWSRWWWSLLGAIGALVAVAIARAIGERHVDLVVMGFMPPLLAWLLARRVDVEFGLPPPAALLCLLVTCLSTWLLRRGYLLPVFVVALLAGSTAEALLRREHGDMDALFGPRAGAQVCEALGGLVRGPQGLHDAGRPGPRVFLLGGRPLYDRGAPGEHVELQLASLLRQAKQKPVDVPSLPTVEPTPRQQWQLFATCYQRYRPDVIVFGVGPDVAETPYPQLVSAVGEAKAWCKAKGAKLVLFADADAAPAMRDALQKAASDDEVFVAGAAGAAPRALAKQLADAIAPLLP